MYYVSYDILNVIYELIMRELTVDTRRWEGMALNAGTPCDTSLAAPWITFGDRPLKLVAVQRRLAWPLRKDAAYTSRSVKHFS